MISPSFWHSNYSWVEYNFVELDLRSREARNSVRVEGTPLVGTYEGFPDVIHGLGRYQTAATTRELRKLILSVMSHLNGHRLKCPMSVVDREGVFEGEVSFEVGVAEGNWFNYLDNTELRKVGDSILHSSLPLDFLLILAYRYQRSGKSVPLRSDRYLVRYLFREGGFDILLSHEKGIRRYQTDDLLNLLDSKIRQESAECGCRMKRVEMRAL